MSAINATATRRRSRLFLLATTFLVPVFCLNNSTARAQQVASALPPIEVDSPTDSNKTRARPVYDEGGGVPRPARVSAPSRGSGTGTPDAASTGTGTGSGSGGMGGQRFNGIVGTSSTVITAEDIAHSPFYTLAEIIGQIPGVQLHSLYGAVNGAGTVVDLRGFGAFAGQNSLVLINGRRLNDLDLGDDYFSRIPLNSVERIEITRGNSGAVLYGDNAVGGVVNIVTKTGVGGPAVAIRAEAGVGSFNQRFANLSVSTNHGPWSTSFYGNAIKSDGYRDNNALDQRTAIGSINYTTPDLKAFFTIAGDDQKLGLPGTRIVDPNAGIDELATNRRGTNTPFDYGNRQERNATTGFTKTIMNGVDLIVDGGYRQKDTQGGFFGLVNAPSFTSNYVETRLKQWSITPRLSVKNLIFGMPSQILTGIDYYDTTYHQDASAFRGLPTNHRFDIAQTSLAGYWQQTIGVLPTTDVSYGARLQRNSVQARDMYDPNAPGCTMFFNCGAQALPLSSTETQYALHAGIEHRVNNVLTLFGRAARAFRTPNADERVAAGPAFDQFFLPIPRTFELKTQTSHDVEGGFRVKSGGFQNQTSVYVMDLVNEIHFDPVNFLEYNLDPTRRYGVETASSLQINDSLLLRGGAAYTRAIFREGPFTGNDVPLVSRYTANAGVSWNIWQKYLVFDATLRAWSSRVMDNDQPNTFYRRIPADATVDLKISGAVDHFFWSFAVNNLFDRLYYDYAVASSFVPLKYAAYPLPGRSYLLRAGVTF
jgi:iron complex outermembrane receptor protein